ncbi:MAG TPA: twin-arginine translocation signal domain-containing protein [Vicinamibacterales bacterium]|nr:twin-arginine translocation signal domain-containing protein [Vicinamibacterales bacterium]
MNRRDFLVTLSAASAALAFPVAGVEAQDVEYLRALERAQQERPPVLSWRARIAPKDEPGIPMVIHGRVFKSDGRTPASGIIVFAYHTDRTGIYADRSKGPHVWRLRGWAQTDAGGHFEFETIRPAPYPGRATAAHVHITLEGSGLPRQTAQGLLFDDDPIVTPDERSKSARDGVFGDVRKVEVRDGVQHVTANFRIASGG